MRVRAGECVIDLSFAGNGKELHELVLIHPVTKVGGLFGRAKRKVVIRVTTRQDFLDILDAFSELSKRVNLATVKKTS